MGNESSQLTGLEIEEKAVEVTDFWTHNSATLDNDNFTPLSVFIGESFVEGPLWTIHTPLEKMAKNLMLHRHPCILKYVSSWNKNSKRYLAVEYVKPLAHAINTQTPLQICIGLYSILKAIMFLHEKAYSSHNNICSASIYVTKDGSWKLGGLEFLCRYEDLNKDYLNKTRAYRYERSIDPNEKEKSLDKKYLKSGAIDKYGFAVLTLELLHSSENTSDIPCLEEFKNFCKTELQKNDFTSVPNFSSILDHPYFTHDFIKIYSFLTELALKTESEKEAFFSTVASRLRQFPEELVARQLGELLMSRLVLLDETACQRLIPLIFKKRINDSEVEPPLFSGEIFQQYIVPRLLHIFCVRDAQIRLLLLTHFKSYVNNFNKEQLQNHILPELLIGIKDTNDHLVAVTLVALSDLVPILGGATVIGGKRLRLFNDGRPAIAVKKHISRPVIPVQLISPIERTEIELPERLSPDGGEDEIELPETTETTIIPDEDLDSWSDWDHEETNNQSTQQILEELQPEINLTVLQPSNILRLGEKVLPRTSEIVTDILTLDIKNQKDVKVDNHELDFFSDMEPVIEKTNKIFIDENSDKENSDKDFNKINLAMTNTEDNLIDEDCWGDDLSWVKN